MASQISLPCPFTVIRYTSIGLGTLSTTMGIRAVLYPSAYSIDFGFPATSSTTKVSSSNPYIPAVGGRNISGGLALIACAWLKLDRALGFVLLTGLATAAVDGWTLGTYVDGEQDGETLREMRERMEIQGRKRWMHWTLTPVVAVAGAFLLRFGKR